MVTRDTVVPCIYWLDAMLAHFSLCASTVTPHRRGLADPHPHLDRPDTPGGPEHIASINGPMAMPNPKNIRLSSAAANHLIRSRNQRAHGDG
jgi:hypothetical protein